MATTSEADLDAAYVRLIEAGSRPTVRALREEARVGRDRAAAYLRDRAAGSEEPPVPAEELTGVLGPLWALAVGKAREVLAEDHQAQQAAVVDSEATALERVESLEVELAAATTEAEQAAAKADRAAAQVKRLGDRVDQLDATIETERARAQAAEARAARAEGEADTLRAVVGLREASSEDPHQD